MHFCSWNLLEMESNLSQFWNVLESKKLTQAVISKLEEALLINPRKYDALWCWEMLKLLAHYALWTRMKQRFQKVLYCFQKAFNEKRALSLKDMSEDSTTPENFMFPLRVRVSNTVLPRAAVAAFGLRFINAGYSGDWSRTGAIAKESEELLKVAAFVVVPLCLFSFFSFPKKLSTEFLRWDCVYLEVWNEMII
ncbi:uncharacterized protein LOC125473298 [Pyrus x bretschneideri]|uniref:uncharacterized protein LOC125473298 n=1 Tax=Pyrus x bretschneideri TaxID=225117 RepID=UPI002030456C|nr:uncharacterized protein LOC125473298 [Pyrus x bretschneideri]